MVPLVPGNGAVEESHPAMTLCRAKEAVLGKRPNYRYLPYLADERAEVQAEARKDV